MCSSNLKHPVFLHIFDNFKKIFDMEFNKSFISDIFSGIVLAYIIYIVPKLYKKIKEQNNKYSFRWIPKEPLYNKNEFIKNINNYPKDFMFDFEKGEFIIENGKILDIDGIECFKMHIIKFMNTERDKYNVYKNTEYGVSFLLKSNDEDEFKNKANTVAIELLKFFSDWIKAIYGIKKYKNQNKFEVLLSVKGIHEIINITVDIIS